MNILSEAMNREAMEITCIVLQAMSFGMEVELMEGTTFYLHNGTISATHISNKESYVLGTTVTNKVHLQPCSVDMNKFIGLCVERFVNDHKGLAQLVSKTAYNKTMLEYT